jgi:hypothetical protein
MHYDKSGDRCIKKASRTLGVLIGNHRVVLYLCAFHKQNIEDNIEEDEGDEKYGRIYEVDEKEQIETTIQ